MMFFLLKYLMEFFAESKNKNYIGAYRNANLTKFLCSHACQYLKNPYIKD